MIVVGHRGARGEAPENTTEAFAHAYANGIRHFELDLQLSADEQLVVTHDLTLKRTTGQAGNTFDFTAAELAEVDARYDSAPWPNKTGIPTLDDIIKTCPEFESIQLEVKSSSKKRLRCLCDKLVAYIHATNLAGRVVVTSSDTWVLEQVKRLDVSINTGYVAQRRLPNPLVVAQKLGCSMLVIYYKIAEPKLVRQAGNSGLHVSAWTVNKLGELSVLEETGIDSVITDYPTNTYNYYLHNG